MFSEVKLSNEELYRQSIIENDIILAMQLQQEEEEEVFINRNIQDNTNDLELDEKMELEEESDNEMKLEKLDEKSDEKLESDDEKLYVHQLGTDDFEFVGWEFKDSFDYYNFNNIS